MSQYKDFTSLPPEQEQTFVVFERRSVEAGQKAVKLAMIVAGVLAVLVIGIVLGISPGESTADQMKDDELSKGGGMLSGESEMVNGDKPTPAPAAVDGDKADVDKADVDKADGEASPEAGDSAGTKTESGEAPAKAADGEDGKKTPPKTE